LLQASIKSEYETVKLNLNECKPIIQALKPKIIIPEHGSETLGYALAKYMEMNYKSESAGELNINRIELDKMKSAEVINLDTQM
jgi:hypothetical protein